MRESNTERSCGAEASERTTTSLPRPGEEHLRRSDEGELPRARDTKAIASMPQTPDTLQARPQLPQDARTGPPPCRPRPPARPALARTACSRKPSSRFALLDASRRARTRRWRWRAGSASERGKERVVGRRERRKRPLSSPSPSSTPSSQPSRPSRRGESRSLELRCTHRTCTRRHERSTQARADAEGEGNQRGSVRSSRRRGSGVKEGGVRKAKTADG